MTTTGQGWPNSKQAATGLPNERAQAAEASKFAHAQCTTTNVATLSWVFSMPNYRLLATYTFFCLCPPEFMLSTNLARPDSPLPKQTSVPLLASVQFWQLSRIFIHLLADSPQKSARRDDARIICSPSQPSRPT